MDTAYTSSCTDSDLNSAHIAADPFCNPIVGMPDADNMDLQTTWGDIQQFLYCDDKSTDLLPTGCDDSSTPHPATDQTDCPSGDWDKVYGLCRDAVVPNSGKLINDFLNQCITRNNNSQFVPMGSANNGILQNGADCVIRASSAFGQQNLIILYNYVQYFLANSNINQGSNLGSQADGSAQSS